MRNVRIYADGLGIHVLGNMPPVEPQSSRNINIDIIISLLLFIIKVPLKFNCQPVEVLRLGPVGLGRPTLLLAHSRVF